MGLPPRGALARLPLSFSFPLQDSSAGCPDDLGHEVTSVGTGIAQVYCVLGASKVRDLGIGIGLSACYGSSHCPCCLGGKAITSIPADGDSEVPLGHPI